MTAREVDDGGAPPMRVAPTAAAPWFFEWKHRPPPVRHGIVAREQLVDRLFDADPVSVISVVAPPGYGKTTLLAQFARRKGTRVAWISVDRHDNDPSSLLVTTAAALDRVEAIDASVFSALASPASSSAVVVNRFEPLLASMTRPVALIFDHVEQLDNRECLDVVSELASRLPRGVQLAIASQSSPPIPAARLRAHGELLEFGVAELAMEEVEATALLDGAGVHLTGPDVTELVRRTEGWPVGLYLAALAFKSGGAGTGAGLDFRGDDRLMAEYLRSEVLARLTQQQVRFLTRTSVLDRLSGPLCDAVLERKGSTLMLESLAESNLLLVPLDRRREWYRYHHLFQELLQSELRRADPDVVPALYARAAAWFEANGSAETAVDYAQAAGDEDGVARLVGALTQPAYAAGRVATVRRWFDWFEDRLLIDRYPPVAVLGALIESLLGHPARAERWAEAAEMSTQEGPMPDGSPLEAWLALLRAFHCRHGVEQMRADAALAGGLLAPRSPLRATALFLEGFALALAGDIDGAEPILARAADMAESADARPAAAGALAGRGMIATGRGDWDQAGVMADRALAMVEEGNLQEYLSTALVLAVAARVEARRGDLVAARGLVERATHLRPLLTYAIPVSAQMLLELARAYVELSDPVGARTVLREVRDILLQRPDLGNVPRHADELQALLDPLQGGSIGASSLTAAELRLVPFLSTHLSFREIGERLYVSRHTIKSQAMAIYRKLGVSSRSEAIVRMEEIGLRRV